MYGIYAILSSSDYIFTIIISVRLLAKFYKRQVISADTLTCIADV